MFGKLKDWAKANLTALIVGFATGAVLAWIFRATIARIIGG